jgi:hypothetical protein
MLGDAGETSASAKNAREYFTYTLEQLRAKISENTTVASNLKHVHDSATCRFRPCDQGQSPALLGTKLHVGSHTATDNTTQAVWAHIRSPAFRIHAKANNHVKYILDDGAVLKNSELKHITFVEPFSYIESTEHETGRDKIRYLILFLFLEGGYSNSIEFTKSGFVTFRIAIANIAKARAQADMAPHREPSTASLHRDSSAEAPCSDAQINHRPQLEQRFPLRQTPSRPKRPRPSPPKESTTQTTKTRMLRVSGYCINFLASSVH